MTGINRQRREHRKNFLLKITMRPGRAFRTQLRDFADPNSIFGKLWEQFVVPKGILGCDHLAHDSPDTVKYLGRAQAVRAHVARFALDLLLDSSNANLEKFVQSLAENN